MKIKKLIAAVCAAAMTLSAIALTPLTASAGEATSFAAANKMMLRSNDAWDYFDGLYSSWNMVSAPAGITYGATKISDIKADLESVSISMTPTAFTLGSFYTGEHEAHGGSITNVKITLALQIAAAPDGDIYKVGNNNPIYAEATATALNAPVNVTLSTSGISADYDDYYIRDIQVLVNNVYSGDYYSEALAANQYSEITFEANPVSSSVAKEPEPTDVTTIGHIQKSANRSEKTSIDKKAQTVGNYSIMLAKSMPHWHNLTSRRPVRCAEQKGSPLNIIRQKFYDDITGITLHPN